MRADRLARAFYEKGLDSLKPAHLLGTSLRLEVDGEGSGSRLVVKDGREYDLGAGGCYVVGFGKAVLGMGAHMCHVLDGNVAGGVLSVPEGIGSQGENQRMIDTCERAGVRIMKGARNNLPDKNANNAALEIKKMVEDLTENDVVIVLISGGGSALLPLPIQGIDLEQKIDVVTQLSKAGASITELNTVRKRLSGLKGGKLAEIAFPAKMLTLILSDVIGNPLDMIASGPTVVNTDHPGDALNIIKKYNLEESISSRVLEVLQNVGNKVGDNALEHVENVIIGSNTVPLARMLEFGRKSSFSTIVLSEKLDGEARIVGETWAALGRLLTRPGSSTNTVLKNEGLADLLKKLKADFKVEETLGLALAIKDLRMTGKPIALLAGGETTVTVTGKGKGGRNQEMVLAFSLAFDKDLGEINETEDKFVGEVVEYDVAFLSCGTDGIDGPTDAAGAACLGGTAQAARNFLLRPEQFLLDNDSWSFWTELRLKGLDCLVKTGHTGTNVMDIQVMIIQPKSALNHQ